MRADCVSNRSVDLSDDQRGRFKNEDIDYPVTVDQSYPILGMGIWETSLMVLIRDDNGAPLWVPAGLFAIPVQEFPSHWQFSTRDGLHLSGREAWNHWTCQWGYPELVSNPRHSDALMERDPDALGQFEEEYRLATE